MQKKSQYIYFRETSNAFFVWTHTHRKKLTICYSTKKKWLFYFARHCVLRNIHTRIWSLLWILTICNVYTFFAYLKCSRRFLIHRGKENFPLNPSHHTRFNCHAATAHAHKHVCIIGIFLSPLKHFKRHGKYAHVKLLHLLTASGMQIYGERGRAGREWPEYVRSDALRGCYWRIMNFQLLLRRVYPDDAVTSAGTLPTTFNPFRIPVALYKRRRQNNRARANVSGGTSDER